METGVKTGSSLVVERGTGTVVIEGERLELPPKEFTLLLELAARPGEVVTVKELIAKVWPETPLMTQQDLYWHVSELRKGLRERERPHKLIENRRGFGYLLKLPPGAVRVVSGTISLTGDEAISPAMPSDEDLSPLVPPPPPTEDPAESASELRATPTVIPLQRPGRSWFRPVVAALLCVILLGASWLAGYWLSRRNAELNTEAAQPVPAPQVEEPEPEPRREPSRQAEPRRARKEPSKRRGAIGDRVADRGAQETIPQGSSSAGIEDTEASAPRTDGRPKQDDEESPPPALPQPDASLYHLVNPDSGDHYMTTSSSSANQMQAQGYDAATEGGVFTYQAEGTVAIALDTGTAYIYRDASSASEEVTITELYRLASGDDFFHTSSSSQANQAEAQGWAKTLAGYVST